MSSRRVTGAFAFLLTTTALVVSQSSSIAQSAGDLPVIVVVRHANKASLPADDPPLTPVGVKRARDLAAALRNAGVTGIITTELRRTRETAGPLATALGIKVEVAQRGPRGSVEHLEALETAARRHVGAVLVIGHDDTVPGLIAHLGGPRLPNICDLVYDNFFMLVPTKGKVSLIHTRYGEPTPDTECK